ncbi:MAG: glutamine synthetase family protein [Paracoccaceae bacterium]|jgi:glutamine synthetase|nr:glutamine synthetase family protein [Paracoccaceae bacterium]MDG1371229.1 glutamine synthetase family protein [Paracoccaceae bacterium]MDG1972823.1 glutamine synthetase family protein [Paracoccaceae bacterium]
MTASTPEEELTAFLAKHPDTKSVDAFLVDINGKAFGKRHQVADLETIVTKGSSICEAMQLTDINGIAWDTAGRGFADGDPDGPTVMVPGTLQPVPWAGEARAQCLMRFWDDGPLWFEPRAVLELIVERYQSLGLKPVTAIEIEFYLIDPARDAAGGPTPALAPGARHAAAQGNVFNMAELDAFSTIIDAIHVACTAQGVPVTTIIKEYGPGQYEINLAHLADPIAAADHAALLRRTVTGVAQAQGMEATFMAKPYGPDSGSGMQVNLSFEDESGAGVFGGPGGDAILANVIGGMQSMQAETMAIFAPNLNAFRRFEPDQFTPVTSDWGEDNRSVAFRVPAASGPARRVEHRIAGADANPYLVMAAVLAAAHHGITNKLTPTPMVSGNAGAEVDPDLPLTLWSALDRMAAGATLPDYFEQRYIDAYIHAKQAEFDAFMADIHPREHEWYL